MIVNDFGRLQRSVRFLKIDEKDYDALGLRVGDRVSVDIVARSPGNDRLLTREEKLEHLQKLYGIWEGVPEIDEAMVILKRQYDEWNQRLTES